MVINGMNGANSPMGQMGMHQATDSYSRNMQNQIASAQKQLQEISSNDNMSLEEKMKKREEIQKKINDLNTQLRQYQMEQRREKQKPKDTSMDDMLGGRKSTGHTKTGNTGSGISQAGMTAIISADSSKKQANVQGSVATNLNGTARVLKSEIEADKKRGIDTQKQEEDLAELEQNVMKVTASQMRTLNEANKNLEEAAEEDGRTKKPDDREERTESGAKTPDGREGEPDNGGSFVSGDSFGMQTAENVPASSAAAYTSVDIRL